MAYDPSNAAHVDFVRRVERRMDEVTPEGGTPTIQAAKVYEMGEEAVRSLFRTARRALLYPLAVAVSADDAGAADITQVQGADSVRIGTRLLLPSTPMLADGTAGRFLRFLRLQLTNWSKPVDVLQEADSPAYRREFEPFERPGDWHPRAFIVPTASGPAVEAFPAAPAAPAAPVTTFLVLTERPPDVVVAAAPELADALLWDAAARTLAAERYVDPAKEAAGHAADALEGARVGTSTEG